jgi:hypothetical protein
MEVALGEKKFIFYEFSIHGCAGQSLKKSTLFLFFISLLNLLTYCLKMSAVIHAFLSATCSTGSFFTFLKHWVFEIVQPQEVAHSTHICICKHC